MCILGDQMLCLRYCFALCKNKFVFCKAIVGFYFGIVRDDVLAVIVFRKNNMFLIVSKVEIFEKVSRIVCRFFIEN